MEEEEEEEPEDGEDSDSEAEGEEEEEKEESDPSNAHREHILSRGDEIEEEGDDDDDDEGPPVKKYKTDTAGDLEKKQNSSDSAVSEGKLKEAACKLWVNNDDAPDDETPTCRIEVRRWGPGNYTLLGDMSSTTSSNSTLRNLLSGSQLDVSLCIGVDDQWDSLRHGGAIVYVAKDDEDELLSVAPHHNALSLVFREKDTASFVKYINSDAPEMFFQIACGFKEIDMVVEIEEEEEEVEEDEGEQEDPNVHISFVDRFI